ncbi:unnamed protein product, partial [marine sediment metagenome]
PVILGDQFRSNNILSKMLLRPAPKDAPFMLQTDAYETLGFKYLKENKIIEALECYRIALDSSIGFTMAIRSLGKSALLNQNEINHLNIPKNLENKLISSVGRLKNKINPGAYCSWVEELRIVEQQWMKLNQKDYGSKEYIELCLKTGRYKEALSNAKSLEDEKVIEKVKLVTPEEILDIEFLKGYIAKNFPESSMFR